MNRCMCGCGLATPTKFVNGHNGRLTHLLYRAVLASEPVEIYGTAYRPDFYAAMVGRVFAGYFQQLIAEASR